MSAIVIGLGNLGIQKLYITWRDLLSSVYVPCVPLIHLYLMDIRRCNALLRDTTIGVAGRPFIHFGKRMKWAAAVDAILLHQTKPYTLIEVSGHPLYRRAERSSHSTLTQDPATMAYIDSQLAAAETLDKSELCDHSQQLQEYEIEEAIDLEYMRRDNIDSEPEDDGIWDDLQVSDIQEDEFDDDDIW
jgi:hypothetical protein